MKRSRHWTTSRWCFSIALFVVSACTLFGLCSPASAQTLADDNFNDNALDPLRWSQFVTPAGPGIGTVEERNQRLEVTLAPGAANAGVTSNCYVGGDFDVLVDFDLPGWPFNNRQAIKLGAVDLGSGPFGLVGVERFNGGNGVEAYHMVSRSSVSASVSTTDRGGKMRLTRYGSILTGHYKNGSDFVALGSTTVPIDPTRFVLNVGAFEPTAAAVAVGWDNFVVSAGVVTCPSIAAPSFLEVLRNSVTVEVVGGGVVATFKPNFGLTLAQAAHLGGYDHFNWLQVVTLDSALSVGTTFLGSYYCQSTGLLDQNGQCPVPPYKDPPNGGYEYQRQECSHINGVECAFPVQDSRDWYFDEEFTGKFVRGIPTELQDATSDGQSLKFDDYPSTTTWSFFFGECNAGFDQEFHTALAGVRADGTGTALYYPGTAFDWHIKNTVCGGTTVLVERRKNTDPALAVPGIVANVEGFVGAGRLSDPILRLYARSGIAIERPAPLPVTVDIKPGRGPNCVNPTSKGMVAVAIVGGSVDLTTVDLASVVIDGDPNPATPGVRPAKTSFEDVNADGEVDLVLHFATTALNSAGLLGERRRLFVTADTADGMPIVGSDVVFLAGKANCSD
jgi:hypothetical protein